MISSLFIYLQNFSLAQQFHICLFSDGYLNLNEFQSICRALFRNDKGKIYSMEPKKLQDILSVFDRNKVCKCYFMNIFYKSGVICTKEVSVKQLVHLFVFFPPPFNCRMD
jgi:hypothetical protein